MNKTCRILSAVGMTVLRGIVGLLMCLCFLASALSFSLRHVVTEREQYRRAAQTPSLPHEMIEFVRGDLETECLFYGLPLEIIDEALSEEVAADFLNAYIDAVYDAVFVSGTLEIPAVDAALFRAPIAVRLEAEKVEDAVIDELAAEFTAVTTASWQMGLNQKLLSPMHKLLTNVWVVRFLHSGTLFAGAAALLFGIGILLGLRRIRRQMFELLGGLTVSSMLLFVPLWLLDRYGIAAKLVLGDSPLRTFMIALVDSFTAQLSAISMWTLIACSVLTVLAVVWVVWPKKEAVEDTPSEEIPAEEIPTEEIPAETET